MESRGENVYADIAEWSPKGYILVKLWEKGQNALIIIPMSMMIKSLRPPHVTT